MMKLGVAGVGFSQAHLATPKHAYYYSLLSLRCYCYLPPRSKCTYNYRCGAFAHSQPDSQERRIKGEHPPPALSGTSSSTSARTQLGLLDQLTSSTSPTATVGSNRNSNTIRQQLIQLIGDRDDEFSIPLGKDLKNVSAKFLTVSQKRNIRRQAYLDTVSQRNDTLFFTTIAASVVFPPLIILGIAIITGYVQLLP